MSGFKSFDESTVVTWNHFIESHAWAHSLAIFFGQYAVYAVPVLWVVWWFMSKRDYKALLLASFVAGALAWQVFNRLLKHVYFHNRPVYSSLPVRELLFSRPENSFPSDHTTFLAAIAFFFLLQGKTKPGWWLLFLAAAVGLSRIALAVHYPSDILAGFASGFFIAWIFHIAHPWLTRNIWEPLIAWLRKINLA